MKAKKIIVKVLVILFPILLSVASGFYINEVTQKMVGGVKFGQAIVETGLSASLLITIIMLGLSIWISFFPHKQLEDNKKELIKNLLGALILSTFSSYRGVLVNAVVQECGKKHRTVKYQYNTFDVNVEEKMDIHFGSVGETCVKNKSYLVEHESLTLNKWEAQSDEYKEIVPKELRLLIGKPIFDEKKRVIGVLEINVFENTDEISSGVEKTKEGYITNETKTEDVKNMFNKYEVKQMFGTWAAAIGELMMEL